VHHRSICSVLRHVQSSVVDDVDSSVDGHSHKLPRSICVCANACRFAAKVLSQSVPSICVNKNTLARMHTRGKQRRPPTHTQPTQHIVVGACPLPRVEEWSAATRPSTPCTTLCLRQRSAVVTRRHSTCAVAETHAKRGSHLTTAALWWWCGSHDSRRRMTTTVATRARTRT
jgi:hypothetical protein